MDCINEKVREEESSLRVVYGDVVLGVHGKAQGKEFHYLFSYVLGAPECLNVDDKEWVYRPYRPCFWRAVTDNDRGNKFDIKSGIWSAADWFIECIGIKILVNGEEISLPVAPKNNWYSDSEAAEKIAIIYTYETITQPSAKVEVLYEVSSGGEILVKAHYYGRKGLPELPVFGMRMIIPTRADKFRYEGLSGETYPDRKAGGVPGIYEVEGLPVTPYLRPQDCGVHMDTKWVEVYRSTELDNRKKEEKQTAIRFEMADKPFAFSCLPYTAHELESAWHQEELPVPRRTVLCIYGAVRGVGGIDSWQTDVEPAYHISAEEDIEFSFRIKIV